MDSGRVLPFLDPSDDAEIVARLQASYDGLPPVPAEQVEACRNGVLSQAAEQISPAERQPFTVRRHWWVGAAAAAALLVVVTMRPSRLDDGSRSAIDSAETIAVLPAGSTTIVDGGAAIRFDLRLPEAVQQVALVGDFNEWDSGATMMEKLPAGSWSAKIPLTPGVHNYAFVVDGKRWMIDPLAPQVPDDGFGPANAVVVVGSR